jgi:hypothetical protein
MSHRVKPLIEGNVTEATSIYIKHTGPTFTMVNGKLTQITPAATTTKKTTVDSDGKIHCEESHKTVAAEVQTPQCEESRKAMTEEQL